MLYAQSLDYNKCFAFLCWSKWQVLHKCVWVLNNRHWLAQGFTRNHQLVNYSINSSRNNNFMINLSAPTHNALCLFAVFLSLSGEKRLKDSEEEIIINPLNERDTHTTHTHWKKEREGYLMFWESERVLFINIRESGLSFYCCFCSFAIIELKTCLRHVCGSFSKAVYH